MDSFYKSLGEIQAIGEKKEEKKVEEKPKELTKEEIEDKEYEQLRSLCQTCQNAFDITYKYPLNEGYEVCRYIRCNKPELYDKYGVEIYYNGKMHSSYNHKVIKCYNYSESGAKLKGIYF